MAKFSFDNVTIDGFRGLRHLELNDLGLVNLLVGENNSGKTSVLEAMSILCDPYNPGEWLSMVERRDFGRLDETRMQSLRWCFDHAHRNDHSATDFEGKCLWNCEGRFPVFGLESVLKTFHEKPSAFAIRKGWRSSELGLVDGEVKVPGVEVFHRISVPKSKDTVWTHFWEHSEITSGQSSSSKHMVNSLTLTPYSYQINKRQVRQFSEQIVKNDNRGLILELIREFDAEITDVFVASLWGDRPTIYLKHEKLGPAPLSTFGDAIRRALLLATTIPSLSPGGLLLIDELETGIHVSALERVFAWLMKMARRFQVQVMATTHSLEAVDAITKVVGDHLDDLVAFQLHQVEEGTKAKRIAGEMLMRLRYERGLDVR